MNIEFPKGPGAPKKHKNDKYVFCNSMCELSNENNFGQYNYVDRLLPR